MMESKKVITPVNLYGQVVLRSAITSQAIPLPESLPSGVYTAVITTGFGKVVKKMVIDR